MEDTILVSNSFATGAALRTLRVVIAVPDAREASAIAESLCRLRPDWRRIFCTPDRFLLDTLKDVRPDLLFVDWQESAVNAVELARSARCWRELEGMRIVALCDKRTASRDPGVVVVQRPTDDRRLARAARTFGI